MAAMSFRALFLILYFFSVRFRTRYYPSLFHLPTQDYYWQNSWRPVGAHCCDFEGEFVSNRPTVTTRVICSTGFCLTKVPTAKWTKHGYTSLLVPGHDPPLDITVCMDILKNPGPEVSNLKTLEKRCQISDLHRNNTEITTYTPASLFSIRRRSRCTLDPSILPVLKLNGILRYRGCRAGH